MALLANTGCGSGFHSAAWAFCRTQRACEPGFSAVQGGTKECKDQVVEYFESLEASEGTACAESLADFTKCNANVTLKTDCSPSDAELVDACEDDFSTASAACD